MGLGRWWAAGKRNWRGGGARRLAAVWRALVLGLALTAASAGAAQTYVELILDASGSMYNRLGDGRYRIEAAKQVLVDLISGLPASGDLHVGLRVYGARLQATADGACEDSHLEVPIAGVDRGALRSTVEATLARGATPIALSLQLAARDFPATGTRRVVLVTDGLESCGGDLEAVAQLYAELGIDLKIVGFDLSASAAAAFAEVADFVNAVSAQQLADALHEALADVAAPAAEPVTVVATVTRAGAPTSEGVSVAFVDPVSGVRVPLVASEQPGRFEARLPPGGYTAEVIDAFAAGRLVQFSGLGVDPGTDAVFAFELAPALEVSLRVERDSLTAGARVLVHYQGAPTDTIGLIALAPADAPDAVRLYQSYVSADTGSVELLTPDNPGLYQARFHLALPEGGHLVVGRSEPFETVAASASLVAPAQVAAGTLFEVQWQGPGGQGDAVVIASPGAGVALGTNFVRRTFSSPLTMTAPAEIGVYELLYLTGQSQNALASLMIEVIEAVVTMTAPGQVAPNAFFDITVAGPVGPRDAIVMVRAGAPDQGAETFGPARRVYSARVQSRAPAEPGEYELRYLAGSGGQIVHRLAMTVR